ncbi:recombination-associated protein RdgC [Chitinibacteraceae bacterium HSL-7]
MLWFKNLQLYRLPADFALDAQTLEDALAKRPWLPCGATDLSSQGFVPPAAVAVDVYAYTLQNAVLIALKTEEKIVPSGAVKQQLEERIKQIEAAEHRKVGRKEAKELKERVVEEMLPRAFTRARVERALIDLDQHLVIVDNATAARAERVLSAIRDALGSLPARLIQTHTSPRVAMTNWVQAADAGEFDLGQDAELKMPGDDGAVVRLVRHALTAEEVQQHLSGGKEVTKLGLMYRDRVAFQLTEKMEIKRFSMLDQLADDMKNADAFDQAALFDSGLTLLVGEIRSLTPLLIAALDGETGA